jgi:hypothetical protein
MKRMLKKANGRDPKMLVPVHIRDFLGDFSNVLGKSLKEVYDAFNPKYLDESNEECFLKFDHNSILVYVYDPMKFESTESLLDAIWFENAMKKLPTNRIIKINITAFDEKENIEYRTNGIRFMILSDTDFTKHIQDLISQIHPESEKLKLVQFDVCGGIHALACDDMPNYHLHFEEDMETEFE